MNKILNQNLAVNNSIKYWAVSGIFQFMEKSKSVNTIDKNVVSNISFFMYDKK